MIKNTIISLLAAWVITHIPIWEINGPVEAITLYITMALIVMAAVVNTEIYIERHRA